MIVEALVTLTQSLGVLGILIVGPSYLILSRRRSRENSKNLLKIIIIGVLTCSGLVTMFVLLRSPKVIVTNDSPKNVYDVVLTGNKFSKTISQISPGESFLIRVYPRGESGLGIRFRSEVGVISTDQELAYLQRGDNVKARITINKDYKVSVSVQF